MLLVSLLGSWIDVLLLFDSTFLNPLGKISGAGTGPVESISMAARSKNRRWSVVDWDVDGGESATEPHPNPSCDVTNEQPAVCYVAESG